MAQVFYFHPFQAYQPKGFIALVPSQVRSGAASDARAWLPSDLGASCIGSFDLSSAAKITLSSGNISAVTNDAAGTVTLTQGTGASQPPFTAGSGAFFALAGATSLALANLASATEYHYFIVATPNANTSYRTALWAAANEHPLLIQTGTDNVGHYISGFQTFGATTAAATVEAQFYAHITPSAVSLGATNGNTPGSTASAYGATNTNAAVFGNSGGGAQGFGWIRALVIVSGTLTDTDRQKIEGYLAWQYSISSNLPITHPYRWQAPTIALSTNTIVALTGLALSIAQGSLLASTALALTGQSASVAQGALAPAILAALSGQSLTAAQGTLSPSTGLSLTGQALSVAQGSVAQSRSIALSGLGTTVAQGSVAPAISVTLSGQSLSVAQGNVTATTGITVALTGLSLSVAQGSVGPSITATITGQSLSAALGSLTVPAPVTAPVHVFTPPPPQRARTRMHGWRVYQPTPYFAVTPPQPLNILPVPIPGVTYIVDANGTYLTDTAGNKIIYG